MYNEDNNLISLGYIGSVYGVKGWVKLKSFTEPEENIFLYPKWLLVKPSDCLKVEVEQGKKISNVLCVKLKNISNREQAQKYSGFEVKIPTSELPKIDDDSVYWHQLEGLNVYTSYQNKQVLLGRVKCMMATGANDVLVVEPCTNSLDARKRLIPWLPKTIIVEANVPSGYIKVDWDPDF